MMYYFNPSEPIWTKYEPVHPKLRLPCYPSKLIPVYKVDLSNQHSSSRSRSTAAAAAAAFAPPPGCAGAGHLPLLLADHQHTPRRRPFPHILCLHHVQATNNAQTRLERHRGILASASPSATTRASLSPCRTTSRRGSMREGSNHRPPNSKIIENIVSCQHLGLLFFHSR